MNISLPPFSLFSQKKTLQYGAFFLSGITDERDSIRSKVFGEGEAWRGAGGALAPFMGILQKGPPPPSNLYPYSFTPPPRAL